MVIMSDLPQVERLITNEDDIHVALVNSPQQTCVSGSVSRLKEFRDKLKKEHSIRATLLKLAGGSHNPGYLAGTEHLKNFLATFPLQPMQIPVIANYNGEAYTDPEDAKVALAKNMSQTAYIQKSIELLLSNDVNTFYELT
jgi:[acyl-carrier-protein] S-malonyltransferase